MTVVFNLKSVSEKQCINGGKNVFKSVDIYIYCAKTGSLSNWKLKNQN